MWGIKKTLNLYSIDYCDEIDYEESRTPVKKDLLKMLCRLLSHSILACGAPGGARFLRVQVPSLPGSGKDIAEGKGVQMSSTFLHC